MQDTQLMLPQICECNGCLLMVEVVSEHFMMTRVSIWALRKLNTQWFKLTSMPQKVLEEVISLSGSDPSFHNCTFLITRLCMDKAVHLL